MSGSRPSAAPRPVDARDLEVLLVDLDGTLIDSEELILSSYRHTMRRHLGRELPDERWLESMGRPLRDQLRDFARDEAEAEAMLETYGEHTRRHHDDLVRPFPEVREAVGRLRRRGWPVGIVTSKRRRPALQGLGACGYPLEWFDVLVAADDVDRGKPDPGPVRAALEAMDGRPGRSVFVGDSIHDVEAGRAAGTATAAALWGPYGREELAPAGPDHWLSDAGELEALLDGGPTG